MRFTREASAAVLLTASLAGCTSAPAPEQTQSTSATPEATPTPDLPTPSTEATPSPDFSEACSDEVALDAIKYTEEPALEPLIKSLENLPQDQLVERQQKNLGILAMVSFTADKISKRFDSSSEDAAIEVENYAQPGQDFSHIAEIENQQILMDDWIFTENGQYCKISSATTELGANASRNLLELRLGTQVFRFLLADGTVKMADGTELTAGAVGVSTALSKRYFRIVDDALKNPETFEFAPDSSSQPEPYINQPDVVLPSEI